MRNFPNWIIKNDPRFPQILKITQVATFCRSECRAVLHRYPILTRLHLYAKDFFKLFLIYMWGLLLCCSLYCCSTALWWILLQQLTPQTHGNTLIEQAEFQVLGIPNANSQSVQLKALNTSVSPSLTYLFLSRLFVSLTKSNWWQEVSLSQ